MEILVDCLHERALPHSEMLAMSKLACVRCGGREPTAEAHDQAFIDEVIYRWHCIVENALIMLNRLRKPRWLTGSYESDMQVVQERAWGLHPVYSAEALSVLRDAICDYLRRVYEDHPHQERRLSEFLDKTATHSFSRWLNSTAILRAESRMGRKNKCHCAGNQLRPGEVSAFPPGQVRESNLNVAPAGRYESSDTSLEHNEMDADFL